MSNRDLGSHVAWLESKRRSSGRRSAARTARRRGRGRRAGVAVALLSLSFATGGAVAANRASTGAASVARAASVSSVAALQRALGITADGVFGPQTLRAVKRFQRAHGLVVDGIAGPLTLAALGLRGRTASVAPRSAAARLARIAACESGGNPAAVSAGGRYRGKYQFSRATWRALGGTGDPAKAPEAEQDRRAAALLAARGTSPWPNCA